jgi:hypothetical protein
LTGQKTNLVTILSHGNTTRRGAIKTQTSDFNYCYSFKFHCHIFSSFWLINKNWTYDVLDATALFETSRIWAENREFERIFFFYPAARRVLFSEKFCQQTIQYYCYIISKDGLLLRTETSRKFVCFLWNFLEFISNIPYCEAQNGTRG